MQHSVDLERREQRMWRWVSKILQNSYFCSISSLGIKIAEILFCSQDIIDYELSKLLIYLLSKLLRLLLLP